VTREEGEMGGVGGCVMICIPFHQSKVRGIKIPSPYHWPS
jgi:hypothetical protein